MSASIRLKELLDANTMPSAPPLVIRSDGDRVRCLACGHRCVIAEGHSGICRMRFNRNGELRVPFGYVAGLQIDPIEKKPFYHAYPARDAGDSRWYALMLRRHARQRGSQGRNGRTPIPALSEAD